MVGFGGGSIGLAVNPPKPGDGVTPIEYMDLTPDEAEQLLELGPRDGPDRVVGAQPQAKKKAARYRAA